MLNYQKIGTEFSGQLANSPVGYISNWMVDSAISSFLFWHYLPGNLMTGTQPQWGLLFEPTRASVGHYLGSNLCTAGKK